MDVFRPLAAEKHLELQINADHVRHEKVVTDQNRLQQVLVNLLSNAIKYTPEGGSVGLRSVKFRLLQRARGSMNLSLPTTELGCPEISSLIFLNLSPGPRSQRPTRYRGQVLAWLLPRILSA